MIRFTKMQALGNDFVVLNAVTQTISVMKDWIRFIADRHRGVGCDQVLMVTPAQNPKADFGYRIFNVDGSEVYQCGNGARCVGLFIQQEKLSNKKIIYLETQRDIMRVVCGDDDIVQVDIAKPNFNPTSLPFKPVEKAAPYYLQLAHHRIQFDVVSVGNPHCVISQGHFSDADKVQIGQELNKHPAFPEGINVGFVQYHSRNAISLCVYERGVGITQACGSGACAAVAVGRQQGQLNAEVTVQQAGGSLRVVWELPESVIQLRGNAVRVFDGTISH